MKSGLTADLMYRILIGDVAMQRGEPAVAARAYFEAAREARDPVLARRATEIGLMARQKGLAVEAAKLWSELDPSAERPKQVIATAGSGGGARSADAGDDELKTQLEKALAAQAAASPAALAEAFLQLNNLLAQEADRAATYKLIAAVAEPYPNGSRGALRGRAGGAARRPQGHGHARERDAQRRSRAGAEARLGARRWC